jgi:hypothetical protein
MRFEFNKQNAKYYGRRGGLATQAKKAREKIVVKERETRLSQELKAFKDFENAESGIFDGFEMVEIFHVKYSKYDAKEWGYADDCAQFTSRAGAVINTGADGVNVYLMTESAVKSGGCKQVHFNRSIYVF